MLQRVNSQGEYVPGEEVEQLAKEVGFGALVLKIQNGKLVLIKYEKTMTVSEK